MDMNRMTVKLQEALQSASALAMRRGHQGIDVEHLLLALMEQEGGIAGSLLEQAGVSPVSPVRAGNGWPWPGRRGARFCSRCASSPGISRLPSSVC